MKGTRFRYRGLGIALVAALGIVAMLALPGLASARGHHHGHHGRHHFIGRHGSRRVLIRGSASDTAGSPTEQENAGEVESFDGTTLTIKLFAGGTVSGKVTESTEIECEGTEAQASGDSQASEDGQEGGENGTENSGDGSQQSDDQSGDQQSGDEGDSSDTEDQGISSGSCGTASLVQGAIVHEAELIVTSHGAVFHSVDLAG